MKSTWEQDRREALVVAAATEQEPPGSAVALRPDESDDTVIERIRNGDVNAFEILMRRYERWVFGIVSKHAPYHQATELVQEVFVEAYQSLRRYCLNTSFRQWLATIAVWRCYYHCRAANRHPTCAISNLSAEDAEQMERTGQAAACEAFHEDMEREMTRETLCQAMDWLEADDQTLLGLIYWQGHSLPETADFLGDSLGTVKSRASRARAKLYQRMDASSRTEERLAPEATLIPA